MWKLITTFTILLFSLHSVLGIAEQSYSSDDSLLLQVKLLITRGEGSQEELEYINSSLDKIESDSLKHEVSFYRSLALIKSGSLNQAEVVDLLESAKQANHPLAIALLYKIYSEPYLRDEKCSDKAEALKAHYLDLYNQNLIPAEFETALSAINKMVL
mgnify:CR=1 FL=1